MPHYTEYRCTECGQETMRELLTAVKVHFTALGPGAKVLRSRTVAWKCDDCLKVDPYYNLPAFSGAPGMKSESLERVREAEANGK